MLFFFVGTPNTQEKRGRSVAQVSREREKYTLKYGLFSEEEEEKFSMHTYMRARG